MSKTLLLFKPKSTGPIKLHPTKEEWESTEYLPRKLECKRFARVDGKMSKIILRDGRTIWFNMWADDTCDLRKSPNLLGTLITNPLAESYPWRILGNCIMEPYDDTPLRKGDWDRIEDALFGDKVLIEKNCIANGISMK